MTAQNIQDDLSAPDTLELRAKLFRGLGDPNRLAILDALESNECSVQEIVGRTGLGQPNVSNHLRCLLDVLWCDGCYLFIIDQRVQNILIRMLDIVFDN